MKKMLYVVLLCCITPALFAAATQKETLEQALESAILDATQAYSMATDNAFEVPTIEFNGKTYTLLQSYPAGQSWFNEYTLSNRTETKPWSVLFQVESNANQDEINYTTLVGYAKRQVKQHHPAAKSIETWHENEPDNDNALVVFKIVTESQYVTFYELEIHRLHRTENTIDDCVYSLSISGSRADKEIKERWDSFTSSKEPTHLRQEMEYLKFPEILRREYTAYL